MIISKAKELCFLYQQFGKPRCHQRKTQIICDSFLQKTTDVSNLKKYSKEISELSNDLVSLKVEQSSKEFYLEQDDSNVCFLK